MYAAGFSAILKCIDTMEIDVLQSVSQAFVDFLWKSRRPQLKVDASARGCVANRLNIIIMQHLGESARRHLDTHESGVKWIVEEYKKNHRFRSLVDDGNAHTCNKFGQHFTTYGGRSAFFAYCLGMTFQEEEPRNQMEAKASLLRWYYENRRHSWILLNGGGVKAWFPFEWLLENFDAIAATLMADGMFDFFKTGASKVQAKMREALYEALGKYRRSFNPYPDSLFRAAHSEGNKDAFSKTMNDGDLDERYFLLFRLSPSDIDTIAQQWSMAFVREVDALGSSGRRYLNTLLQGLKPVEERSINSDRTADLLRDRNIAQLIELEHSDFVITIYPPDTFESGPEHT